MAYRTAVACVSSAEILASTVETLSYLFPFFLKISMVDEAVRAAISSSLGCVSTETSVKLTTVLTINISSTGNWPLPYIPFINLTKF